MVKLNVPPLFKKHSNTMHNSIAVALLDLNTEKKKMAPRDGNIDEEGARLCLLGVLKHPKHSVLGTHKKLDEWIRREISVRTLLRY